MPNTLLNCERFVRLEAFFLPKYHQVLKYFCFSASYLFFIYFFSHRSGNAEHCSLIYVFHRQMSLCFVTTTFPGLFSSRARVSGTTPLLFKYTFRIICRPISSTSFQLSSRSEFPRSPKSGFVHSRTNTMMNTGTFLYGHISMEFFLFFYILLSPYLHPFPPKLAWQRGS